jgi:XTP/dITP diphosphohydrolase
MPAVRDLLIATSNAHKTAEIAAMLGDQWRVRDLRSQPDLGSPEETGLTFEANAAIKALAASQALPGVWVLADDSGLEVDALSGEPGVRSARYAGATATDADNRQRLQTEMKKEGIVESAARFRCAMVIALDGESLATRSGAVEGRVRDFEQGAGGFGYDSMFVPDGYGDSFGVLPAEVKNHLSHRAQALGQIINWLATLER